MRRRNMAACTAAVTLMILFGAFSAAGAVPDFNSIAAARICLGGALIAAVISFSMGSGRSSAFAMGGRFMAVEEDIAQVSFSDVAANEEARASLMELADYLRQPEKYEKMGARMPKGVLLYGPPGTGKTLLARALAGEAKVPFFALSGSDFVQMYVGVGAKRVRELFDKARKAGRCVIFIDEIDALGRKREDSTNDEREQTLNALLAEMSGFRGCAGTLVLAATNRAQSLDPALLRPGRFDRQIEVGLPGKSERLEILKLHAAGKPMDADVDLENLAQRTVSFSGASLESLLNEAAIRAASLGREKISRTDIDWAFVKGVAGADKKPVSDRSELKIIAVHEAGHALAGRRLLPENQLARVSILPSGKGAAGYNLTIPRERALMDKERMDREIMVLLAGRAAEELAGGREKVTSGAANDLSRATDLAVAMALDFGMEGDGCVSLRQLQKSAGSAAGDGAVLARETLKRDYALIMQLLERESDALLRLAQALMEKETMSGEEIDGILQADA